MRIAGCVYPAFTLECSGNRRTFGLRFSPRQFSTSALFAALPLSVLRRGSKSGLRRLAVSDNHLLVKAVLARKYQTCFAESHAAKIKHSVITMEKTIGMMKEY